MLTNFGDLSVLGAVAAIGMLTLLVVRELLFASDHRSSRPRSLLVSAVLLSLSVAVGGASAARIAPLLEPGRDGPRLDPPATDAGPQLVPHSTETFDTVPIHAAPSDGWTYSVPGAAQVVAFPTSADRSLELIVAGDDTVSACRSFTPVTHGTARINAFVLDESEGSDGRIGLRAMGGGGALAEVNLARDGVAEYSDGASSTTARGAFQPTTGKWFRVTLAVHLNVGQYEWTIRSVGEKGDSLSVSGAKLNQDAVRVIDQFCLVLESEAAGARLLINNLTAPR